MVNNLGGTYNTGTASIDALDTVVTGSGTLWSPVAEQGDWFFAAGHIGIITDTFDDDTLNLELPWTGGALSSQPYILLKMSWLRYEPAITQQHVRTLIADLTAAGIFQFVAGDEPDPGNGVEDQWALKADETPWKLWKYVSGSWVLQSQVAVSITPQGEWNALTAYVANDSVSNDDISYVAIAPNTNQEPPNGTYWQVLAAGSQGPVGNTPGIQQNYSTTITDADPGAGTFRLNNTTPASATAAYLDNLDSEGVTISSILDTWDNSTATIKGVLKAQKSTDATVWAQWQVTGSVVDGTGYRKLTLTGGVGSGAFTLADEFSFIFIPTGNNGIDAPTYGGTSTTSLAIGTGSKVFTTQAGLAYLNGARVRASSASGTTNWMEGLITYSGTTLTMTSDRTNGSGTKTDWNFNPVGEPGAGDLNSANNLSDLASATTARVNLGVRETLSVARTYYVRADGNDSNTGLVDSAGGAFLTIQKGIDTICSIDSRTFQATLQVGPGTYTGANVMGNWTGSLPPFIIGDQTTPSNVLVHTTSADCFLNDGKLPWHVRGFRLRSTTSGSQLRGKNGGTIYFQLCDFGVSAGNHIWFETGARVITTGNYSISGAPGGDGIHILISDGGIGSTVNTVVTITGTPAWAGAYASATRNGTYRANGMSFSGSATGNRRSVSAGGVIYTGGGDSFFPGNATGSGTNSATSPYGNYL